MNSKKSESLWWKETKKIKHAKQLYDCSLILYKRSFGSPNSWKLGLLFFCCFFFAFSLIWWFPRKKVIIAWCCFWCCWNLLGFGCLLRSGDWLLCCCLLWLRGLWLLRCWFASLFDTCWFSGSGSLLRWLLGSRFLCTWFLYCSHLSSSDLLSDLVHWTKRFENFDDSEMKIQNTVVYTQKYYVRCSQAAVVGTWIETDPFGTNRIQNNLLWTFTVWNLRR